MPTPTNNLAGYWWDKIVDIRRLYRIKDDTTGQIFIHKDEAYNTFVVTLDLSDGCTYEAPLSSYDGGESAAIVEAGRMIRDWIIAHGYRPVWASEVHNVPPVPVSHDWRQR